MTEPFVTTKLPTYEQWLRTLDKATSNRLNAKRREEISKFRPKGERSDYFVSESWKELVPDQGGLKVDAPVLFAAIHPAGGIGFQCEDEAFEYATQLHQKWLEATPEPHRYEGLELITSVQKRIRWETYNPKPASKSKRAKRDAELDEEFDKPTLRFGTIQTVPEPGEQEVSKEVRKRYMAHLKELAGQFRAAAKRDDLDDKKRTQFEVGG